MIEGKLKTVVKEALEDFLSENCEQPCVFSILPDHIHVLINLDSSSSVREILLQIQAKILSYQENQGIVPILEWESGFHAHSVSTNRLSSEKSGIMRQELIHQELPLEEELKFLGM
ncbi:hypothetical protein Aconfl_39320 [Algoriphagus confluentis]|uniref:Transposase IS200-like domain-containing protein n=1 Tax=Algoriphagus confluentis TaxID=1697556 RepID=A0ABQ6PTL2_9BACT|nr:hypothetical protein Aconfl_39320 [Algoriphagus confluentis]